MNAKHFLLTYASLLFPFLACHSQSIPYHDHVLIVILENKNYNSIIGSKDAPYINSLLTDPNCALLERYYALTHPSQPNYIRLFSGDAQNIILDFDPPSSSLPYTTPNLGGSLIDSGYTFIGYSEDLPSVGYTGSNQGSWVRRHCPWVNWQDASINGIPSTCNLPFTSFPANYDSLPTLCLVVPNMDNDMHDGTVSQGDAWVKTHLDSYAQWAKSHNSLLIITFDETESYISNNKVPTLFIGQNVQAGKYSSVKYDHNDLLRTLEEMYGLPYAGESANGNSIYEVWKNTVVTSVPDFYHAEGISVQLYPNPVTDSAIMAVSGLKINDLSEVVLKVYDTKGNEVSAQIRLSKQINGNDLQINIHSGNLSSETYFYELLNKGTLLAKDKFIVQ